MAGLMTRMGEEEEDKGEIGGRGKRENTGRTYWQWDQRPDASNSGPHKDRNMQKVCKAYTWLC